MFQSYTAPPPDVDTPGRYTLKGVEPIGNYALRFSWDDGHQEGIYTWEHLRSLCECNECLDRRPWRKVE